MSPREKLLTFSNNFASRHHCRVLALVCSHICLAIIIKFWPWLVGLTNQLRHAGETQTNHESEEEVWPTTHVTPIGLKIKIVFHMPRCHLTGQAHINNEQRPRYRPTTFDHAYPLTNYVPMYMCVCLFVCLCNSWQCGERANGCAAKMLSLI